MDKIVNICKRTWIYGMKVEHIKLKTFNIQNESLIFGMKYQYIQKTLYIYKNYKHFQFSSPYGKKTENMWKMNIYIQIWEVM